MANIDVTLDARVEIAHGRHPCGEILQIISRLEPNQGLRLLAPFEPVPLYERLAHQGFGHEARELPGGDWEVRFAREIRQDRVEPLSDATRPQEPGDCVPHEVNEVDARGLEPPEPIMRVLEALGELPAGHSLRALTDRRPIHLFPLLEQRGFTGLTEPLPEGGFETMIRELDQPHD